MRQMRGSSFGVLLVAAVAMGACGNSGDATPAATATGAVSAPPAKSAAPATSATAAPSVDPKAEAAAEAEAEKAGKDLHGHHRHHHHGGIAMFIHMAIDSLGLPAEKKAQVEKIQEKLHAAMAPSREAGRAVLTLLADGVAAGKLDTAKIDAAVAKQEAASAGVHAATIEALNELHAALSPAERSALVEKVKAHVEVWKKVNHDEEYGSKDKTAHLAVLTTELSLTPEQVEKISAALKKDAPPKPDAAALDAHVKAFETAFMAEKFDAKDAHHRQRRQHLHLEDRDVAAGALLQDRPAAAHSGAAHQARGAAQGAPQGKARRQVRAS